MNFSSLSLPVCNMAFPSQINVDRIELFTLKATAASQLSQRMLGFNVQNAFEFGSSVACLRLLHEGFGCIQQISEARKPHRPIIPKALGVKPCNRFQSVVLSSMRIAAKIPYLCQFAKDRTARWIAERCLKFPQLFQPLRCALTGQPGGPDLFDVMELLWAESTLRRIDVGLERLA